MFAPTLGREKGEATSPATHAPIVRLRNQNKEPLHLKPTAAPRQNSRKPWGWVPEVMVRKKKRRRAFACTTPQ